MKRELLYIFGEPGAGKSTLMAYLTRGLDVIEISKPFAMRHYPDADVTELGPRRRGGFPGTDGLSMSVQPTVIEWLRNDGPSRVIAEGDRLANGRFFEACRDMGYSLHLVHLKGESQSEFQRNMRAVERGTEPQDPSWVAGRRSKSYNLAQAWWPLDLPAGAPLSVLERTLFQQDWAIWEAFDAAREARVR